jgi:hypothetical protein
VQPVYALNYTPKMRAANEAKRARKEPAPGKRACSRCGDLNRDNRRLRSADRLVLATTPTNNSSSRSGVPCISGVGDDHNAKLRRRARNAPNLDRRGLVGSSIGCVGEVVTCGSRVGRLYGLTMIQLATSAAVALGCQVLLDDWQGSTPPISRSAAAGIIFLGAAATGGAFVALSWAQTRLDTTTTAVILTLEPLVGAVLGPALGDAWTASTLGRDHCNHRRLPGRPAQWTNRLWQV